MKTDTFLKQKLADLEGTIPLNYSKAELKFSRSVDFNTIDMVKFISVPQYRTNQFASSGPNKPISRVFTF